MEPSSNLDGAELLPVSMLARRHGLLQRALYEELRKARVKMIIIANQPQVLDADYREWLRSKISEAAHGVPGGEVRP